jgi:hypothetical protein
MLFATVQSGEGMWVNDGRGDPVLYSRANGVGQIYDLSRLLPSVDNIVHLSNPPLALAVLGLMKLP